MDSLPPSAQRLTDLEIRHAFIEQHIEQQDREIVELRTLLDKQTAELARLRDAVGAGGMEVRDEEKPPHY